MSHLTPAVREGLVLLEAGEQRLRETALAMLRAHGGALFVVDLVAIAALRRSLSQSAAFRCLIERKMFPSAAILLRTQLDSALRFSAFWHVADPEPLARGIIRGEHVRDFADRTGRKLTDRRLVELQHEDSDWVPEVYDRTSGFVHLSEAHVAHAFVAAPGDDGGMNFAIGVEDEDIDEETYILATAAFDAATDLLLEHIERWTREKEARTGIASALRLAGQTKDPAAIVRPGPT